MTPVKSSGLNMAALIPVGATVTDAYWCEAGTYGPGRRQASQSFALRSAIKHWEQRNADYRHASGSGYADRYPYPERLTIDLRWKLSWPAGTRLIDGRSASTVGQECTIERFTYDTITEAREHLARIVASAERRTLQ